MNALCTFIHFSIWYVENGKNISKQGSGAGFCLNLGLLCAPFACCMNLWLVNVFGAIVRPSRSGRVLRLVGVSLTSLLSFDLWSFRPGCFNCFPGHQKQPLVNWKEGCWNGRPEAGGAGRLCTHASWSGSAFLGRPSWCKSALP